MKLHKSVAVSESGFLFHAARGDSFTANPIGVEIIRHIQEGLAHEEIKALVLENYDVDEVTFEKDYYDFVKVLKQYSLIEE